MTEHERNFTYAAASVLRHAGAVCRVAWTKGYDAIDHNGKPCALDNPNAACWCASTAIQIEVNKQTETYRQMREIGDRARAAMVKAIRVLWPDADLYRVMYPDANGEYDYDKRCTNHHDIIVNWNDKPERKQAEVVSTLDRAAGMLYERVSVADAERLC